MATAPVFLYPYLFIPSGTQYALFLFSSRSITICYMHRNTVPPRILFIFLREIIRLITNRIVIF